VTPATDSYS